MGNPSIWVVTWGSQRAMPGDQVSNPLDAGVWGYCRSLHKEKPGQMLGLVDLPPMDGAGCDGMHLAHPGLVRLVFGDRLARDEQRAVAGGRGMLEVALRGGQAYARRVANASPAAAPGGSWPVACGGHQHALPDCGHQSSDLLRVFQRELLQRLNCTFCIEVAALRAVYLQGLG